MACAAGLLSALATGAGCGSPPPVTPAGVEVASPLPSGVDIAPAPRPPPSPGTCIATDLAAVPVGRVRPMALAVTPAAIVVALGPDLDAGAPFAAELIVTGRDGVVRERRGVGDVRGRPFAVVRAGRVHVLWPGGDHAALAGASGVLGGAVVFEEAMHESFTLLYAVEAAGDGWLAANTDTCSCFTTDRSARLRRFDASGALVGTWRAGCSFGLGMSPVVRTEGGWVTLRRGDEEEAPSWVGLDDRLAVQGVTRAGYLARCAGEPLLVAAEGGVVALCDEGAFRVDARQALTGVLAQPLGRLLGAVAFGGRVLTARAGPPFPATPAEVCLSALGDVPRDCFRAGMLPFGVLEAIPPGRDAMFSMRVDGEELVLGWIEATESSRSLRLRSYRCDAGALAAVPRWARPSVP
jgi:hypothetical protein